VWRHPATRPIQALTRISLALLATVGLAAFGRTIDDVLAIADLDPVSVVANARGITVDSTTLTTCLNIPSKKMTKKPSFQMSRH
jgi:hypothetical protein